MTTMLMKQLFQGNEKIILHNYEKQEKLLASNWKTKELVEKYPDMEIIKITIVKKGLLHVYIHQEDAELIDIQEVNK